MNLTALRTSIHALQAESAELDAEKAAAEKELERVIKRWQHRRSRVKRVFCKVTRFLGFEARQCAVKKSASELEASEGGEHVRGKRTSRRYAFPPFCRIVSSSALTGRVQATGASADQGGEARARCEPQADHV